MPITGRKPNPDRSQVVTRHKPQEFTEIENIPFEGAPPLRARAAGGISVMTAGAENSTDWPKATREWWQDISRMPHAALWGDAEWRFAMDCAEVHARTMEGWRGYAGSQMLSIAKQLGQTADYRRDLRIRYVEPKNAPVVGDVPADVARLDDYRGL